jgi:dethiobiotin synthetase
MKQGIFVTGTDTGVGKTLISCALLHGYAASGKVVVGMKPVAAGCEPGPEGLHCDDVARLRQASSVRAPRELVSPYAFEPPIAPHLGAEEAGVVIELEHIRRAYRALAELADVVVVEGVGGFRVPLNLHQDSADLASLLALPVVLVVGMRLGCLNHALLAAEAIAVRGLPLAGWVANRIDPEMSRFDASLDALQQRLGAPLLGVVPHEARPEPASVARNLLLPGVSR